MNKHELLNLINQSFSKAPNGLMLANARVKEGTPVPEREAPPAPEIDQTRISNRFRKHLGHVGVQQKCRCGKVISSNKKLCATCKEESESLAGRAKAAGLVLP